MNKTILVGIDFSDCSINALEHAITIAEKASADVVMIWVNRPESGKEIFRVDQENIVGEVINRFNKLVDTYKKALGKNSLSYLVKAGKVYQEIVNTAEELDAFIIIVGTHGSSGFEEFWIGSNANRIVAATERPIITIRDGVDASRTISNIVLPIDSSLETRQKVPITSLIAKYFDAKIHILVMHTTTIEEVRQRVDDYVLQVERYFYENQIEYIKKIIETNQIADATVEYAVSINANLISIMDEQERIPSNLWLGTFAQQMVNHSPVPVLCVHARDLIADLSR
ncbi:MAG: universal stress protein [Bacteroidales bacterium]|nr:universal stress protein [Bacteroidales bacterium]